MIFSYLGGCWHSAANKIQRIWRYLLISSPQGVDINCSRHSIQYCPKDCREEGGREGGREGLVRCWGGCQSPSNWCEGRLCLTRQEVNTSDPRVGWDSSYSILTHNSTIILSPHLAFKIRIRIENIWNLFKHFVENKSFFYWILFIRRGP